MSETINSIAHVIEHESGYATAEAHTVIPEELSNWLVKQTQAGHTPEELVVAFQAFGWKEDQAVEILESVLSDFLQTSASEGDLDEPVPLQVPEPALVDSPVWLDVGDKQVRVAMQISLPKVLLVDDFLSNEECKEIIALAQERLHRSEVLDETTGEDVVDNYRTSDGTFLDQSQTPTIQKIDVRIGRLLNWPLENAECLQVLRYAPGAQYKPHHDYFDPITPGGAQMIKRHGQRVGTLLMYLSEPEKGGSTGFPDVGVEISPRKGSALFFSYNMPDPCTQTLHAGLPVIIGEKWVATKWLLEKKKPV